MLGEVWGSVPSGVIGRVDRESCARKRNDQFKGDGVPQKPMGTFVYVYYGVKSGERRGQAIGSSMMAPRHTALMSYVSIWMKPWQQIDWMWRPNSLAQRCYGL
jgi:hypothetical protein